MKLFAFIAALLMASSAWAGSFGGGRLSQNGDLCIAIWPDMQFQTSPVTYSLWSNDDGEEYNSYIEVNAQWLVDQMGMADIRVPCQIEFVMFVGDLVQYGDQPDHPAILDVTAAHGGPFATAADAVEYQYDRVRAVGDILKAGGMPFFFPAGDHDYDIGDNNTLCDGYGTLYTCPGATGNLAKCCHAGAYVNPTANEQGYGQARDTTTGGAAVVIGTEPAAAFQRHYEELGPGYHTGGGYDYQDDSGNPNWDPGGGDSNYHYRYGTGMGLNQAMKVNTGGQQVLLISMLMDATAIDVTWLAGVLSANAVGDALPVFFQTHWHIGLTGEPGTGINAGCGDRYVDGDPNGDCWSRGPDDGIDALLLADANVRAIASGHRVSGGPSDRFSVRSRGGGQPDLFGQLFNLQNESAGGRYMKIVQFRKNEIQWWTVGPSICNGDAEDVNQACFPTSVGNYGFHRRRVQQNEPTTCDDPGEVCVCEGTDTGSTTMKNCPEKTVPFVWGS